MADILSLLSGLQDTMQPLDALMTGAANTLTQSAATASDEFDQAAQKGAEANQTQFEADQGNANVAYARQKNAETLQRLYNLDPDDSNNFIAQQLAERQQNMADYQQKRAAFDKVNETSLFTDPLNWMLGRIQMPQLAAQVNDAADRVNLNDQNIQTRQAELIQGKQAITANVADQEKSANLAAAAAKKQQADSALLQASGSNRVRIAAAEVDAAKAAHMAVEDKMGLTRLEIERQSAGAMRDLNETQKQLLIEEMQDRLKKAKGEQDWEDATNTMVRKQADMLGIPNPPTVEEIRRMPADEQRKWLPLTQGNLGVTSSDAAKFVLQQGNPAYLQNQGGVSLFDTAARISKSSDFYTNTVAGASQKPEAVAEAKARYDGLVKASATGVNKDDLNFGTMDAPGWNTYFNPYKIQIPAVVKSIDAHTPGMQNNALVKTLRDLTATTPPTTNDGNLTNDQQQQAVLAVAKQAARGQIDPAKAASDIAKFYQYGMKFQRDATMSDKLGLPAASSYIVTVGGAKLDLSDPQQVQRLIAQQVLQRQNDTGQSLYTKVLAPNGGHGNVNAIR